jgi:hypothetical protein
MTIQNHSDFTQFQTQLMIWLKDAFVEIQQGPYVVFFSYGNREKRCQVWNTSAADVKTVINRTLKFIEQLFEKNRTLPEFLKCDIVTHTEKKTWAELDHIVTGQLHNNHFRQGVSFDEHFDICFLEQEIYGRALIKGLVYSKPNFWDEKNLNDTIKIKYPNNAKVFDLNHMPDVWVFDTQAVIYEESNFIPLQSTGPVNGVRVIQEEKKPHIKKMIEQNAAFLHAEIQETGQFNYGYFPAYNRALKGYNTVRHCTSLYALLETLEVNNNTTYLPKIKLGIEYAIRTFYKEVNDEAFMIDGTEGAYEIKLGANAAAIFMFAKYQEITGDDRYLSYAEALADGILSMIDANGETTHVLHYPSLEEKEKFRIVYYDGEAALGLLRLYQINQDPKLLDSVRLMFDHFIAKKYDKYHDHWLSYCANELTKIDPQEKYFQFGINNYLKHMRFIQERKTAYATFLEMMMSAYKMVKRLKEQGYEALYVNACFEELKQLIEGRVEYQRTGFFYPEVAMYMAVPKNILNAFYVRHDRFRTRIDDQEHNLSGYIAYFNHFENGCIRAGQE